jgi:hypothetical protein
MTHDQLDALIAARAARMAAWRAENARRRLEAHREARAKAEAAEFWRRVEARTAPGPTLPFRRREC